MKQGKRLTRDQKILLSKHGYDPKKYLLRAENGNMLILNDKQTCEPLYVEKPARKKR